MTQERKAVPVASVTECAPEQPDPDKMPEKVYNPYNIPAKAKTEGPRPAGRTAGMTEGISSEIVSGFLFGVLILNRGVKKFR